MELFKDLELNIQYMEDAFRDCGDVVKRRFPAGGREVYVIYIDMLTDREVIDYSIVARLLRGMGQDAGVRLGCDDVFAAFKDGGLTTADLKEAGDFESITLDVLSGDTALFISGLDRAIVVSTRGWPSRGVPEANTEVVVQGSKEAFTEAFRVNTMLVRRRIRDTRLKVKQMKIGRRSSTDVALMYMEDIVRGEVLEEAERRLGNIDIDAVLDVGMVEGLIEDDWLSPFPQTEVTERPDKAAAAILEGRIAIIVDNSPAALIIPATAGSLLQSSEDYYQRFHIMSFVRVMRFIAGFFAVALPGLYIATAVYHPSMIPMRLAFKMSASREDVPFPAVVEILIMEFAFELLREAGIRLPNPVGSAVGIVGGLIVGQAAVEAGIVSPIVVIIIALTGIASFAIPGYSLASGFRLAKYLIIALSAVLGLLGFWAGMLILLIHLSSLKSFGTPYLYPFASGGAEGGGGWRDGFIRAPLFTMTRRPFFASAGQRRRLNPDKTGNKREKE